MYNIACLVEYNGSNYLGFQKQKETQQTIQTQLEVALSRFAGEIIHVITAGRTDAGVHATGQVINFHTTKNRTIHSWICGTNSFLHNDIRIKECVQMNNTFNARFDAISRTYQYYLLISKTQPAVFYKQIGWYYRELNYNNIQIIMQYLIGWHDFTSFRASSCQAKHTIKNITQASIHQLDNGIICFTFTANSFLYHMIRNIMGAIIYLGCNKIGIDEFKQLLLIKNRTKAPPTFMPDGLYLTHVNYSDILFTKLPTTQYIF